MSALFFIIDALRVDYLSSKSTPVINHLLDIGRSSNLVVYPTFANRLELMSGKKPATTGSFTAFQFKSPNSTPHHFWNLPVIRNLTTGSIQIGFLLSLVNLIRKGRLLRYPDLTLFTALNYLKKKCWVEYPNIPLALLPYLQISPDICEYQQKERTNSKELITGYLCAHGYSTDFIYGSIENIESRVLCAFSKPPDVRIIHYGELDELGHHYGPESPRIAEKANEIDRSISKIIEAQGKELQLVLITSDHDMLPIREQVDIIPQIKNAFGENPEGFRFFVNGSLVRFTVYDKKLLEKLIDFLSGLSSYGRIVPREEMHSKGIPGDMAFGDLVFWAHPGVYFWPNYYHRSPLKGMHTYFDHSAEVPLILYSPTQRFNLRPQGRLIDVYPTFVDALGIPIPDVDGRSLILR